MPGRFKIDEDNVPNGPQPFALVVDATFGDAPTPTITLTPSPTPEPGGTVHVGDMDGSSTIISRRWNASVAITIHDGNEIPVANASVSGSWSAGATGTGSCVTNGSGQCTVSFNNLRTTVASVTFTVTNVTVAGRAYTPGSNHDPESDSNGTNIVVSQQGNPEPTATPTPTATPGPGGAMHVGDLDGSSVNGTGGRWNATVTITVHDTGETPVSGATVSGSWSAGASGNASCVTNASGQCSVSKANIRGDTNSVTFGVTNVTKSGSTYSSAANHDPETDSNGTVIVVAKP